MVSDLPRCYIFMHWDFYAVPVCLCGLPRVLRYEDLCPHGRSPGAPGSPLTGGAFLPALYSPRRPFGVWSLLFLFPFYSSVSVLLFCFTVSALSFFFSKKNTKPFYLLIIAETFSSHLSSMSQRFPPPMKQTCQEVPALGWSLGFVPGMPGSCCFQVRRGVPSPETCVRGLGVSTSQGSLSCFVFRFLEMVSSSPH